MHIKAETERLILRDVMPSDEDDFFEMDSDAEVHKYIRNLPVHSIEQIRDVIKMLQKQYADYGIARWAVVDKISGEVIGWCGLKYFTDEANGYSNFYELGYRFKKKHWGKGYATESAMTVVNYGFKNLALTTIYAMIDERNQNSRKVLEKLGFKSINKFIDNNVNAEWFELVKPI